MNRSQLNVRIDSELLSAIQERAKSDGVALNDWVKNVLQVALASTVETLPDSATQPSTGVVTEVLERLYQLEKYQQQCERRLNEISNQVTALQIQRLHSSF